jgi:Syntaxin
MNDRLGDLGGGGGAFWNDGHGNDMNNGDTDDYGDDDKDDGHRGDVEMAIAQPKHMEHFFREVESIKDDIEQVERATRMVSEINESAIHATTTEEENDLSNRLRSVIDQTNKCAKRTKTLLGLLKEETKKLKEDGTGKASDLRYVQNEHITLSSRTVLLSSYWETKI